MAHIRWLLLTLISAVVFLSPATARAAGCPNGDLAPAASNLEAIGNATLCLLNAERARHGLRPLAANDLLARAGAGHVRDMVARRYFAHDSADGRSFADRIRATGYLARVGGWTIGENLAWGTAELATPAAIVDAWMRSPGHRANILQPAYREIGLAVAPGNPVAADGAGATYATEFGAVTGARGRESRRFARRARATVAGR